MWQPLNIALSRWKAPTELWSRWNCICIMGRGAAVQLYLTEGGTSRWWAGVAFQYIPLLREIHMAHHVNIMLQIATCCITCICSVLTLPRWTPTLGQRSWSGILGLPQVWAVLHFINSYGCCNWIDSIEGCLASRICLGEASILIWSSQVLAVYCGGCIMLRSK